ncbi:MAG: hypothetical protein ABR936_17085 [Bacteroidota bacterium]
MISSVGFKQTDTVLRILPGALLLIFIAADFREQIITDFKLNSTDLIFLIATGSYPLGIILEQLSGTIKNSLLKYSKYSDDAHLLKYYGIDRDDFWDRYIELYSKCRPELIAVVEYYNRMKYFFVNMATGTIISLILNIYLFKQIFSLQNVSLLIFIIMFFRYHFTYQRYYFSVFYMVTKGKNSPSRKRGYIPPPPKPPKLK